MHMNWTLPTFSALSNHYFLMRHGESYALQKGLIVSDPNHGISGYGLTPRGKYEVRTSLKRAKEDGILTKVDAILTSPFLRALETAQVASQLFGVPAKIENRLGERGFGELELTSMANYIAVQERDRANASQKEWGVESAREVFQRASLVIEEYEAKMKECTLLLCTHADIITILLCGYLHKNLECHTDIGTIGTGDLRQLGEKQNSGN